MNVLSSSNGDDLDLDSSLSNINDGDDLVGLLLVLGSVEASLLPLLDQPSSVSNENGGGLVHDLKEVDSSVSSGLSERVPLLGVERSRSGDHATIGRSGSKEVGSGLEEGLEEQGGDLRDGENKLLGSRLEVGRGVGSGSSRSRLEGLLSSSGGLGSSGRRRNEDVDLVTREIRVGDGDDLGGRGEGEGRGGRDVLERLSEQVSEASDGVFRVLDELGLGSISDVLERESKGEEKSAKEGRKKRTVVEEESSSSVLLLLPSTPC